MSVIIALVIQFIYFHYFFSLLYFFAERNIYGFLIPLLFQMFLCLVTMKTKKKRVKIAIRCIPLYMAVDAFLCVCIKNYFDPPSWALFGGEVFIFIQLLPYVLLSQLAGWLIYLIIEKIYRKKHPYALEPDVKKYEKPIGGIHSDADAK